MLLSDTLSLQDQPVDLLHTTPKAAFQTDHIQLHHVYTISKVKKGNYF
jgi:hypothetical protein